MTQIKHTQICRLTPGLRLENSQVSPKMVGVRRSVPRGVSRGLLAPVSGVSKKCPERARRALKTPRGTLRQTPPIFRDTLSDTLRDTSGPKGRKDSCAWSASSQVKTSYTGTTPGLLCSRPGRLQSYTGTNTPKFVPSRWDDRRLTYSNRAVQIRLWVWSLLTSENAFLLTFSKFSTLCPVCGYPSKR